MLHSLRESQKKIKRLPKIKHLLFIMLIFCFVCLPQTGMADQPEMTPFESDYVNDYLINGWYLLEVDFEDMEQGMAQVVRFYENHGWGVRKQEKHSGIAIIYEENTIDKEYLPIQNKIKTGALHKIFEFLTNKTRGAFREDMIDNRVLVIRKQIRSLLYGLEISPMNRSSISIRDALNAVLDRANRSNKDYKIRLDIPPYITPREGRGPKHWAIYQRIPASYFDREISLDINGNKLLDGLSEIIISQPVPLYLTLKADTISNDFTHVLRFDSLPQAYVKDVERTRGHYIID